MLKLTLRPGEFIDIGENVRVILQEVQPERKKTRQNRVQADTTRKVVFLMKHRKRL